MLVGVSGSNPMNVANERWSTAGNNETDRERKSGKIVEWFSVLDCNECCPRSVKSKYEESKRKGVYEWGINCWNSGEV